MFDTEVFNQGILEGFLIFKPFFVTLMILAALAGLLTVLLSGLFNRFSASRELFGLIFCGLVFVVFKSYS